MVTVKDLPVLELNKSTSYPEQTIMSHQIKNTVLALTVLLLLLANSSDAWAQFSGSQRGFRLPSISPRGIAQKILTQQDYSQPAYNPPTYQQPSYSQPRCSQPSHSQPVYSQPVYSEPVRNTPQPAPAPTPIALARKYTADARTLFQQGKYAEAAKMLDEVVKRAPKDTNAYQFRSLANFARGEFEAAAADAYDGMALGNSWTQDVIKSVYGAQGLGVYNNHLAQLSKDVAQKPTMQSHFLSAYYNLVNGNWSAGKTQLEKVLELQPEEPLSKKLLAAVNTKLAADQKTIVSTAK